MSFLAHSLHIVAGMIDYSPLPNVDPNRAKTNILNIVFSVVGIVSFMLVVIGGFRYVTAAGDPNKTAQAKKTVLYALIGLAVTLSAFTIVQFVVKGIS